MFYINGFDLNLVINPQVHKTEIDKILVQMQIKEVFLKKKKKLNLCLVRLFEVR